MRLLTLSFMIFFFFTGCSRHQAPLPTVEKVDIDRYLGTWYEIARYDHSFEVGCSDVSATYTLRDDGKIEVLNRCKDEDGKIKDAKGIAYAVDETNSKLKVSFFRPFYGDYWVIILDDDYGYAVIGEPSRKYFWILSRTPRLAEQTKQEILKKMPSLGYLTEPLIWTKQE